MIFNDAVVLGEVDRLGVRIIGVMVKYEKQQEHVSD